jgi:threonine dehydrogenase-like Zn-dependent dehydrogenase
MAGMERFEWLVEATGSQDVLSSLLQNASTGATLLLLGLPYSSQTFNFEQIVAFDRSVIGSVGSSGADFDAALTALTKIDAGPFLRQTYPLADFEQALAAARSKSALKVMIVADVGA